MPEALPLGVLGGVENLRTDRAARPDSLKLSRLNMFGGAGRDEGRVRGSSDLRNLFEQFHIFGRFAEFVVADQRAERMSAENAEFFFVDLLEHRALVELGGALQIAEQVFLGGS